MEIRPVFSDAPGVCAPGAFHFSEFSLGGIHGDGAGREGAGVGQGNLHGGGFGV